MRVGLSTALLMTVSLTLSSCGGGCPQPSVVGAPPGKHTQQAFALPLGEDGSAKLKEFLSQCESAYGEACDGEVSSAQFCAAEALIDSGDYTSKLLDCSGARAVDVHDPREQRPLKGVVVGGWVFAHYRDGVPDRDGAQMLVYRHLVTAAD